MENGSEMYSLAAQLLRYVFVMNALLIVYYAVKGLIKDARRSARLRRLMPTTGLCGELVVVRAEKGVRVGMTYPVIREGIIGRGRGCDIRIPCRYVHRKHATFEMTADGLRIRARNKANCFDAKRRLAEELVLRDGDKFSIDHVEMRVVLNYAGTAAKAHKPLERFEDDGDDYGEDALDLSEETADDLFVPGRYRPQPLRKPAPRPRFDEDDPDGEDDYDEYEEVDEYDDGDRSLGRRIWDRLRG